MSVQGGSKLPHSKGPTTAAASPYDTPPGTGFTVLVIPSAS